MKIINLIENTEGASGCAAAHGLSFYVETKSHKLLVDLGPSAQTLENAAHLGVDLEAVDTVILSHGHYDHSGGIMPFAGINSKAKIYMQCSATDDYYSDVNAEDTEDGYRFIGIDGRIQDLPQVVFVDGDLKIDDELFIFTIDERSHPLPSTNDRLFVKKEGEYIHDDFGHEHFVVVSDEGKNVLLSGCAHNGILSILDAYKDKFGGEPDIAISGFHLMREGDYTPEEVAEI
ncbi:MAG: MBL fold metallo-hydrolase, partial [Eubacterium sp.]|nr:MBL fold metallo-hydrolase [Eubacterium sp.]